MDICLLLKINDSDIILLFWQVYSGCRVCNFCLVSFTFHRVAALVGLIVECEGEMRAKPATEFSVQFKRSSATDSWFGNSRPKGPRVRQNVYENYFKSRFQTWECWFSFSCIWYSVVSCSNFWKIKRNLTTERTFADIEKNVFKNCGWLQVSHLHMHMTDY